MSKKITLQLLQTVANVGKTWEIIEVNHTYGMNVLVRQNKAQLYSGSGQVHDKKDKKEASLVENRTEIASKLHGKTLTYPVSGHHASLTKKDIVHAIKRAFHVSLLEKHINIMDNKTLKKPWTYDIKILLHSDTYIHMYLTIVQKAW